MLRTWDSGTTRKRAGALVGSVLIVVASGVVGASSAAAPGTARLPGLAPSAVPPATGNNAVITVKVGGSRSGSSSVTNLAGVELGFYATATGDAPVFTCTSDADGDCSIVVPDTQIGGVNRNRRFWVGQISAPAGWYANPSLGTGVTVAPDAYRFQTGPTLQSGNTYRSTVDFMIGTGSTNVDASGGVWQNSLANPDFPAQCGIDVAIVHDLSNSVTAPQLADLKEASAAFVDALTGTPSSVSTFTFASDAPAAGAANTTMPLTSVATAAGAQTVKAKIAGFTAPGGNAGGTNWDRGLAQVAEATSAFDVAIVITDGNPTFYGQNAEGPGNRTRFREVENGIFSANAIKAERTRVIAFGVGAGVDNAGSGLDLRAISGTTLGEDYYQTANYAQAGQQLRALALGSCEGSISVVKQVVPPDAPAGSVEGAVPAPDWSFTAGTQATGVGVVAPATRTTDENGAVNFPLTFDGGVTTGTVDVVEEVRDGYTLEQVDGSNATCTRTDTGADVASTNVGDNGFAVTANAAFPISCVVYNRAPNPPATVTVEKSWVIDGTTYTEETRPTGFTAVATIDGAAVPWGITQSGFTLNEEITIAETVDLSARPGCTLDSQQLTSRNGSPVSEDLPADETLSQTASTYTLTNVVSCTSRLTLAKEVRGGPADPAEWTLAAIAPAGALPGPAGTNESAGVTQIEVTPDVRYGLTETGSDLNYVQYVDPNAVIPPGNSGSWTCQEIGPDGEVIPGYADGLQGGVTVPLGYDVRCTTYNDTATLGLRKVVENRYGGSAVPSDWQLTATPLDGPPGLEPVTVTGANAVEWFSVRPNVTYQLTESGGPPGYSLLQIRCVTAPDRPREVVTVRLAPVNGEICTYTNVEQPVPGATLTLVKEVVNRGGGTASPRDWTLSADGPTPVSGASGTPAVTNVPVEAGEYDLAESAGPDGYTASDWDCADAAVVGATVTVPSGGDVTCTITNVFEASERGSWTVAKSSDPVDGRTVEPGDVVTYTVRAGMVSGTSAAGVVVVDDLSDVLDDATFVAGSVEASAGTATLSGARLTWEVGVLSGVQTLTYQVRVDRDASAATIRNVVTAEGAQPCPPAGPALDGLRAAAGDDCRTTTHATPSDPSEPSEPSPPTSAWPGTPGLPGTGGPGGWIAPLALLLLFAGALLLAARADRSRR